MSQMRKTFLVILLLVAQHVSADFSMSSAVKVVAGYLACGYGFVQLLHRAAPAIDTYMNNDTPDTVGKQALRASWNILYAAMIPAMLVTIPFAAIQKKCKTRSLLRDLWV